MATLFDRMALTIRKGGEAVRKLAVVTGMAAENLDHIRVLMLGVKDAEAALEAANAMLGTSYTVDMVEAIEPAVALDALNAGNGVDNLIDSLKANNRILIVGEPKLPMVGWQLRSKLDEAYRIAGGSFVFSEEILKFTVDLGSGEDHIANIRDGKSLVKAVRRIPGFFAHRVEGDADSVVIESARGGFGVSYTVSFRDDGVWIGSSIRTIRPLLNTLVVLGTNSPNATLTEGLGGALSPLETLQLMIRIISKSTRRSDTDSQRTFTLNRIFRGGDNGMGFSACFGPSDMEVADMDRPGEREQIQFLRKYAWGMVVLKPAYNGRGAFAFSTGTKMPQPWPKLANVLTWLNRDTVGRLWWRLSPKADGIIGVPEAELITGDNPFGAVFVDGTKELSPEARISARVKNPKHMRATTMSKTCGSWTGPAVISGRLGDWAGEVLMSHQLMKTLTVTRIHEVVRKFTFDIDDVEGWETMCLAIRDGWKVKAGDTIKPGTVLAEFEEYDLEWAGRGAKNGEVIFCDVEDIATPTSMTLVVFAFIQATYTEAAKFRVTGKGMVQSALAAGASWRVNGARVQSALIPDGFFKNTVMAEAMTRDHKRVRLEFKQRYEPESVETLMAKLPKNEDGSLAEGYSVEPDARTGGVILTIIDENAIECELTALVEAPTVQEAVGTGGMTLPQLGYLGSTKPGSELLDRMLLRKYAPAKLAKLSYLAKAGSFGKGMADPLYWTGYVNRDAIEVPLGLDEIDIRLLNNPAARRRELLEELARLAGDLPGFQLKAVKPVDPKNPDKVMETSVWFDPKSILAVLGEDSNSQLADLAYNLARYVVDKATASAKNAYGMIFKFRQAANHLANSRSMQRVYGKRWGVGAKAVSSPGQTRGTVRINPNGDVAELLAEINGCSVPDLNGRFVYLLRYPAAVGMAVKIVFDVTVGMHVFQVNTMEWRENNGGDYDGDTGMLFLLPDDPDFLLRLITELETRVPMADVIHAACGVKASSPLVELSGQAIDPDLTATTMMTKVQKPKSVADWMEEDLGGVDAQTTQTGRAYRIMESALIAYTMGLVPNLRLMYLGGFLYEHRGLAAKTVKLVTKTFLDIWAKRGAGSNKALTEAVNCLYADLESIGFVRPDDSNQDSPETADLKQQLRITSLLNKLALANSSVRVELLEKWSEYIPADVLNTVRSSLPIYEAIYRMSRRQLNTPDGLTALAVADAAVMPQLAGNVLYELAKLTAKTMRSVQDECMGFTKHDALAESDDNDTDY